MTEIEGIAVGGPPISGSTFYADEAWSEEAVKTWIGMPFMFEGGQIGTVTKAWVSEDGHTVYFEAEVDLP